MSTEVLITLVRDEFTLEVPIGITVYCISMGTFNLITTLIHFHCQKNVIKVPILCIGSSNAIPFTGRPPLQIHYTLPPLQTPPPI